jgi:hypothetical protein
MTMAKGFIIKNMIRNIVSKANQIKQGFGSNMACWYGRAETSLSKSMNPTSLEVGVSEDLNYIISKRHLSAGNTL